MAQMRRARNSKAWASTIKGKQTSSYTHHHVNALPPSRTGGHLTGTRMAEMLPLHRCMGRAIVDVKGRNRVVGSNPYLAFASYFLISWLTISASPESLACSKQSEREYFGVRLDCRHAPEVLLCLSVDAQPSFPRR